MKYEDHPCVGESDRDFADIDRMLMVENLYQYTDYSYVHAR